MIRRASTLLTAAACVAALSGCATFTNDDVVATVDGTDLTTDGLTERYDELVDRQYDEIANAQGEVAAGQFLAELPEGGFHGGIARAVVETFVHQELLRRAGVVEFYEQGPDSSGVVCLDLAAVLDLPAAEDAIRRLEAGEAWTDVAPDPALRSSGCAGLSGLGELAIQLAGISPDDPYRTLLFEEGQVAYVRWQSAEDAEPAALYAVVSLADGTYLDRLTDTIETAEVSVDPQYGTYDPEVAWFLGDARSIAPLG